MIIYEAQLIDELLEKLIMKMVLEVAKTHPEYHWLCADKDGKRVGTAYAVEQNGYVEMDDLWVTEEYRHQRIATKCMQKWDLRL